MISILAVFLIFVAAEVALRQTAKLTRPSSQYSELILSTLGGAIPLALLGAQILERQAIAVLLSLVGFGYFIIFRKSTINKESGT